MPKVAYPFFQDISTKTVNEFIDNIIKAEDHYIEIIYDQ